MAWDADQEARTLAVLAQYDVLDTVAEAEFDELTSLAAAVCHMPIALLSFFDSERQWVKSKHGSAWNQAPREQAFCRHVLALGNAPLVVPDTLRDPRFSSDHFVQEAPRIRAYAGVPLLDADGNALGTLSVLDSVPRALGDEAVLALQRLARQTVNVLELRRLRTLERIVKGSDAAIAGAHERRRVLALEAEVERRKIAEERLTFAAFHDELTRLGNRAYLERRLEAAIANVGQDPARRATVLFIDLDRFKRVNDRLGHLTGDLLLTLVARRLELSVRPGDTVARIGGDEFMILLEGVGEIDEATELAKRIATNLAEPYQLQRLETFVTVSIGIAFIHADTTSMSEVLSEADIAMYQAKELGRNRVALFQPYMRERDVAIATLESDLRVAWEHRQFFLAYQPIVSLETSDLVGFEALLRWRHPTRGIVAPADFIPAVEEIGMIVSLGEWIITEACRQLYYWQHTSDEARALTMSVNLSALQLGSPDLVDHVDRVMKMSEIVPGTFTIELTESVIMEDFTLAADVLERLRALGVKINMDYFGTGYSSLNYLRQLPIDRLKIDRAFVSGEDGELGDPEIVDTIVSLAHKLGIAAIAEGVETEMQRVALAKLGCDAAQGFLYAPAVAPPQVEEMLRVFAPDDPDDCHEMDALEQAGAPVVLPARSA